ncbi:MAG: 2OG-Fe(II) oxygenase [Gammaproteobacteria bacterium]
MTKALELIDLEAIKGISLQPEPFPYAIINSSLNVSHLEQIQQTFPAIHDAGSFPLSAVQCEGAFAQLIAELKSEEFRALMAEKFAMDLSDKPVMITVRGKADHTDGRIHKDSKSKLITVLLYMNEDWQPDGGRLRLLHDNHNLDNYFAEVPPNAGTMLIFKVTENGWHGHKTFIGTRKVIQLNYVTGEKAMNKHAARHRISAAFKKWKRKLFRQSVETTY